MVIKEPKMGFVDFIQTLLQKVKVEVFVFVAFIVSLILITIPLNILCYLGIENIKLDYKNIIGIIFVSCFSYYVYSFYHYAKKRYFLYMNTPKVVGTKFFLNHCIEDEMSFLIEKFYDFDLKRFCETATIGIKDGRKKPLEFYKVIYRASSVGDAIYGVDYNLHPYALLLLNKFLNDKVLVIDKQNFDYKYLKQ